MALEKDTVYGIGLLLEVLMALAFARGRRYCVLSNSGSSTKLGKLSKTKLLVEYIQNH